MAAEDFAYIPQPVAGVAMVLLAIWLLYLDFGGRIHRALALFLVLRGFTNLLQPFVDGPGATEYGGRVYVYFIIAAFFAGLHLALVYRERYLAARPVRWAPWALLAAALAFEALYVVNHGLAGSLAEPGPLVIFRSLRFLSYLVIALLLLADYARAHTGPRRQALYLASLGFALDPVFLVATRLPIRLGWFGVAVPGAPGDPLALVAALLLVAVLLVLLARHLFRGRDDDLRARARRYLTWVAVVAATALATLAAAFARADWWIVLNALFDGLWTLALPVLLGYAIVRHRLFDIDVKLRFTVRSGTLAAIFIAVFFIVSQLGEAVAYRYVGEGHWALGGVAAGLLLFALAPLQRLSERVAAAAVPGAAGTRLTLAQRREAYLTAARVAWSDGWLDRSERSMLDGMRERLGLSTDDAVGLEREASAA